MAWEIKPDFRKIYYFLFIIYFVNEPWAERQLSNVNNSFFFSPITNLSLFNPDPFPSSSSSLSFDETHLVIDSKWIKHYVECEVNTIRIITGFGKLLQLNWEIWYYDYYRPSFFQLLERERKNHYRIYMLCQIADGFRFLKQIILFAVNFYLSRYITERDMQYTIPIILWLKFQVIFALLA